MSEAHKITERHYPVIVVGSGVSGLATALTLAPIPVLVLTKTDTVNGGCSPLALGGIAVALGEDDSFAHHAADTINAGAGLSDPNRVQALVSEGPVALEWLFSKGFSADRAGDGRISLAREAAHSRDRVLHVGGDATGQALITTLANNADKTASVTIETATLVIDLIVRDGAVCGVLAWHDRTGWQVITADAVVLATGGVGALWQATTNPGEACGDGLALAARAGAVLSDLEFMQFHPTALLSRTHASGMRLPLLTEALRGAGARLLDGKGQPFMQAIHPLGDLAPRDIVARALWERRVAGENVTLDLRPAIAARGAECFPKALAACVEAGHDPRTVPVPVAPAAHYHMGGIKSDALGRTSLPGLWACGEVASTGVHGANRLASNSLLEALVWARRVAGDIVTAGEKSARPLGLMVEVPVIETAGPAHSSAQKVIRELMMTHVGLVRSKLGLVAAISALSKMAAEPEAGSLANATDARAGADGGGRRVRSWSARRNMLLAARLIAQAALKREESRGAHNRSDFSAPSSAWHRHQDIMLHNLDPIDAAAPVPAVAGSIGA